ncbi:MAG: alanine racemase [Actinomycetota bacterium]|jgi:alanine racemase
MTLTKHVNLSTYRQNLKTVLDTMAPAKVMAVVKADAYGHGLVKCAEAAVEAGAEALGVLDIETGIALRKAGITAPAFAWLHSPESNFADAVLAGIDLSVSSISELETIAKVPGKARIHLKIDTGLSRNGCRVEFWPQLVASSLELQKAGEVEVVAIWSHLSGASQAEDEKSLVRFKDAYNIAASMGFQGFRHVASSPAAFSMPESRFEMVRIGVAAFGTSPIEGRKAIEFGLQSPMKVTAEVIAPQVISVGFLHGYFSNLAGKAKVLIGNHEYLVTEIGPLASRIEAGAYEIGDSVLAFGDESLSGATAESLCELVGTVTDELFTGLKSNLVSYSS